MLLEYTSINVNHVTQAFRFSCPISEKGEIKGESRNSCWYLSNNQVATAPTYAILLVESKRLTANEGRTLP